MEAIILIGIQGAGKSTFYEQRFFDTHLRLSLDLVKTRHRQQTLLQTCLSTGQRVVIDNTNILKSERAAYIAPARAAGFRVIGYFFTPVLRASIKRNSLRTGKQVIPVPGLIGTFKRLQPPTPDEGFDELWQVEINEQFEFVVSPYVATPEPPARQ